jgi:hypothetical protein
MASLTATQVAAIDVGPQSIATSLTVVHAIHTHPIVHIALVVLAQRRHSFLNVSISVPLYDLLAALVEALFVELRARAGFPWGGAADVAEFGVAEAALELLVGDVRILRGGYERHVIAADA